MVPKLLVRREAVSKKNGCAGHTQKHQCRRRHGDGHRNRHELLPKLAGIPRSGAALCGIPGFVLFVLATVSEMSAALLGRGLRFISGLNAADLHR